MSKLVQISETLWVNPDHVAGVRLDTTQLRVYIDLANHPDHGYRLSSDVKLADVVGRINRDPFKKYMDMSLQGEVQDDNSPPSG